MLATNYLPVSHRHMLAEADTQGVESERVVTDAVAAQVELPQALKKRRVCQGSASYRPDAVESEIEP